MVSLNLSNEFKKERNRKASQFYDILFHDKWTGMVIKVLYHKSKGFNEILNDLYISPSNLSKILKQLEKYHIIEREVLPTRPISVSYSLTEAGIDFIENISFAQTRFIQKWFSEEFYMENDYIDSLLRREPVPGIPAPAPA